MSSCIQTQSVHLQPSFGMDARCAMQLLLGCWAHTAQQPNRKQQIQGRSSLRLAELHQQASGCCCCCCCVATMGVTLNGTVLHYGVLTQQASELCGQAGTGQHGISGRDEDGRRTEFKQHFYTLLAKALHIVASDSPIHIHTPMAVAFPLGATQGSVSCSRTHGQEATNVGPVVQK